MKPSPTRLIVTIAAIIVVFWLIGLALKVAGWLLNLLLPVAAAVLIVAIVSAWYRQPKSPRRTSQKKEPLRISRDTSDKK
jgi:Flp pilus assembly protein TadB